MKSNINVRIMTDPIGSATIMIDGKRYRDVDVYPYRQYRSIFNPTQQRIEDLPDKAVVRYRGNRYIAEKFGNPNNQRPTYDFTVENTYDGN